jgi:hypothetical protein
MRAGHPFPMARPAGRTGPLRGPCPVRPAYARDNVPLVPLVPLVPPYAGTSGTAVTLSRLSRSSRCAAQKNGRRERMLT